MKKIKYDRSGYTWDKAVIKNLNFVNESLTFNDFVNNLINNFDEQAFYYKDYIIDISSDGRLFYCNFFNQDQSINIKYVYDNPKSLISDSKFLGKTLKEIWNELK